MAENFAIEFSAIVFGVNGGSLGSIVGPTANGGIVVASSANRTAGCRANAVIVTTPDNTGNCVLQHTGTVPSAISGLGAGTASPVIVSSSGVMQRKASPVYGTDVIVGDCTTTGEVILSWGVSQISAPGGGVAGADTQIQFNDGGSLGAISELTYNKVSRSLRMGSAASANSPTNIGAVALCNSAVASGDASLALGFNNQATSTYSQCLGSNNVSSAAASSAVGESLTSSAANTFCGGYNTSATGPVCVAIGEACFASGNGDSFACGVGGGAPRYGEFGHGGGRQGLSFQGLHAIDFGKQINATSSKLTDGFGSGLILPANSQFSMKIRVLGVSTLASGPKRASYVFELSGFSPNGSTLVIDNGTSATVSQGSNAGSPPAGWGVTVAATATNGELGITCNSGSDNVRWCARIEWAENFNVS